MRRVKGLDVRYALWGAALLMLAALVAVHVVVTARYAGGRGRRALLVAATIGAIPRLLLRLPPPSASNAQAPRSGRRLQRLSSAARDHLEVTPYRANSVRYLLCNAKFDMLRCEAGSTAPLAGLSAVSYTHLTLPTN